MPAKAKGFLSGTVPSPESRPRVLSRGLKIDRSRSTEPSPADVDAADEELCPVECVREVRTRAELDAIVAGAAARRTLVVLDFYRTACGSCKYIATGFAKLCRGEGELQHPVIFLKHNVMDEDEQESDIADALRIRVVPLFHFYQDGALVESFATRDKGRIKSTIEKYTAGMESPTSES